MYKGISNFFCKKSFFILAALVGLSSAAWSSTWQLDNTASALHFSSSKTPKNGSPIVEENKFGQLTGTVDEKGVAILTIDLRSVDTRVPLRDTRLQEKVFDTQTYPTATFTTQLNVQEVLQSQDQSPHTIPIEGTLNLHGMQHPIKTTVIMQQKDPQTVEVKSSGPLILDANQYNMQGGIADLQALMFLESISAEIPISFTLVFKKVV